jgi:hypothetical protein
MKTPEVFVALGFAVGTMFLLLGILELRRRQAYRNSKLPFSKRYPRPPGESLRRKLEEFDDKLVDKMAWLFAIAGFLGIGVYQCLTQSWVAGGISVGLAVASLIWWAIRFEKHASKRRNYYLGFLGERAVGEELNQLLAKGWSVFHDVPFEDNPSAKGFNVDHVVVGVGGLFAIETKARRKRTESGGHEVTFDGRSLHYPWGAEDRGVKQSKECAHRLGQWLSKKLQTDLTATPVLVLPGWYVHRTGKSDVRVVNEGAIPTLFRDEHKTGCLKSETATAVRALLDERCRQVEP